MIPLLLVEVLLCAYGCMDASLNIYSEVSPISFYSQESVYTGLQPIFFIFDDFIDFFC